MGYHGESITLHFFIPDADGEYPSMLHEDDGQTFAFRNGAFYRTEFRLRREGASITLQSSVSGNGYPEFARKRFLLIFHGPEFDRISINGHKAQFVDDVITLVNSGSDFYLEAELNSTKPAS